MIGILFQLFVFVLVLASAAYAEPSQYVPKAIWGRIHNTLKANPTFAEATRTLCFRSAESSYGLGVVKNCVYRLPDEENTLWLMKQDIETAEHKVENLIGIYVDVRHDKKRPVSYYLELDRPLFDKAAEMSPVPYKVPCFICHVSGPRLIRPGAEHSRVFSATEKKLLNTWNQELSGYKLSDQYVPAGSIGLGLRSKKTSNRDEVLRLSACAECHNAKTGVRGPLIRMHAATIHYLTFASEVEFGHGFMPSYDSSPLTPSERTCLEEWIQGQHHDGCANASKIAKPVPSKSMTSIQNTSIQNKSSLPIDKTSSSLTVSVQTTFHDFVVNEMAVSGHRIKLAGGSYAFESEISLSHLNAGISARSNHTKTWLDVATFPVVRVAGVATRVGDLMVVPQAKVTLKGMTHPVDLTLTCDDGMHRCTLTPLQIDLSLWGLVMPSFLGIHVSPTIKVNGTLAFKSPSDPASH